MQLFVVGSGKLANALLTSNLSIESCEVVKWESHSPPVNKKAIVVHAGSGRQLQECLDFCARTKSIFIELSTGMETERMNPGFPLIICPNTSILVLKALHMIKANGSHFEGYEITITESHQSTKKTEPGTAVAFAASLKFPPDNIVSIRDPEVQQNAIGIPEAYLDKHAYHKIVIQDGNDEITIETKVLGHSSYAKGVKAIIEMLLKSELENKRYSIGDFIDTGQL